MAQQLEVFQVDAFTTRQFTGNPAGVVLGADALDEATMLAIARELNNADTAFVSTPDSADCDLHVRFFTPRTEASFVGHATLAVHAVLNAREPRALRRQRGRSGIVEVRPHDGGFEIRQARAPLGRVIDDAELETVLAALGLSRDALDPRYPATIVGQGSTRLLLGLREASSLANLAPDGARLAQLSPEIGAPGYFLFTQSPSVDGVDVESRMFCPALGIAEDPVSGNAHGMLAVYLDSLGLLRGGRLAGAQGHFLGRPGRVEVELLEGDALALRGRAVIVFETRISL